MTVVAPRWNNRRGRPTSKPKPQTAENSRQLFTDDSNATTLGEAMKWIAAEMRDQEQTKRRIAEYRKMKREEELGQQKRELLRLLLAKDDEYQALQAAGDNNATLARHHAIRTKVDKQTEIFKGTKQGDTIEPGRTIDDLKREAGMRMYEEIEGQRIPKYRHAEERRNQKGN